jgi:hypothetical protein
MTTNPQFLAHYPTYSTTQSIDALRAAVLVYFSGDM